MDGENNGKPYEQMDDLRVHLVLESLLYQLMVAVISALGPGLEIPPQNQPAPPEVDDTIPDGLPTPGSSGFRSTDTFCKSEISLAKCFSRSE